MGDRCTGHCCRSFNLPFTHEEWRRMINERDTDWHKDTFISGGTLSRGFDMELILSMVTPLPDDGPDMYTCRLFDGKNCGAYEIRPAMCSDYPYGRPCQHGDKCQWDAARTGQHPPKQPRLPVIK